MANKIGQYKFVGSTCETNSFIPSKTQEFIGVCCNPVNGCKDPARLLRSTNNGICNTRPRDGFEQSITYQVASGAKIHFTIHRNERGSRWGDFTGIHGRLKTIEWRPDNAT